MRIADLFMDIRVRRGRMRSDLGAAKQDIERFTGVGGRALSGMVAQFTAMTAGAVSFTKVIRDSIRVTAGFERQMAFVSTMLSTRQMPMMEGLSRSVETLSMRWGESTETLSRGLYDILSASVKAQHAVGVLNVAVQAAKGGFTTTAVAADALTTIINAYGMRAEDAAKISDIMFMIVKRGKLTYEQLATSIGRVAGVASLSGLRLEELGGSIMTITRQGHNAWMTMTSLMGLMQAFLKPQEDAIKVARRYGIELSSRALKEKGLLHIVRQLKDANAEEVATIAGRIRGFKALAALIKDIPGLEKDITLAVTAQGEAAEAAAKAVDTLANKVERLKAVYEAYIRLPLEEKKKPGKVQGLSAWQELMKKYYEREPEPSKGIAAGSLNLLQTAGETFTKRGGERFLATEKIWLASRRRQDQERQRREQERIQIGLDRIAQFKRISGRLGGGVMDVLGFGAARAREIPGAIAAINETFMARRRMESQLLEMRLRNDGEVTKADIEAARRAHEIKIGLARREYGERLKQTPLFLRNIVEGEQQEFERLAEQLLQANIKAIEKDRPKRLPQWRMRDMFGPETAGRGLLGPQVITTWGGRIGGRDPMAKTEQLLADIRLILRNQARREQAGMVA